MKYGLCFWSTVTVKGSVKKIKYWVFFSKNGMANHMVTLISKNTPNSTSLKPSNALLCYSWNQCSECGNSVHWTPPIVHGLVPTTTGFYMLKLILSLT